MKASSESGLWATLISRTCIDKDEDILGFPDKWLMLVKILNRRFVATVLTSFSPSINRLRQIVSLHLFICALRIPVLARFLAQSPAKLPLVPRRTCADGGANSTTWRLPPPVRPPWKALVKQTGPS